MKYNVTRSYFHTEYTQIEADFEEEALEIAEDLNESEWKENPNDEYLESWLYNAEPC